jgi:hypothetical protein
MRARKKVVLFHRRGIILYANAKGQRRYIAGYSLDTPTGGITFPWFPKWLIRVWAERKDVEVRFDDEPVCAGGETARA